MAVRIFKNAWFERFTRKQRIADAALADAVRRAERGQIDADLGGGVIKQRVARAGQGKSGGYRTIILFRLEQRAFFVFGFAKSEQANIEDGEEALFKKMAKELLALSDAQMAVLIGKGRFSEVEDGEEV
ncbi:type II toxin-antitoxin system RelE/ParE family toxin [Sinorhizobium meliloti]|uniref:type II toxin-antitoxin system RelE/ParE family toxin n=1 Tax=Rhizobium meliloti TaxID=382 RepID=UPI0004860805|nr:type II toxin-antitoxin system RelE/ParE family toxin [Sinorhizobium meliloti]MDE4621461.1 type II toxin-antitoxin system RelE/ParE family toxin [Sinorhizobium meliloti]RVG94952.1 type II toxin-antitoxin system RelE/ParE family toxin [Sinorhizobium meliloti]RVH88046.1 type II toxin-antitoxin system RelE/ParE family toxin [Sinorhizobium meliloti]RVM24350.1 type II toxin-antitoxin system RelE/ParE family toxin [Sinorhizobium meliloti]RVO04255.1 type II toxin-antitoxin system RelE/ParE family 